MQQGQWANLSSHLSQSLRAVRKICSGLDLTISTNRCSETPRKESQKDHQGMVKGFLNYQHYAYCSVLMESYKQSQCFPLRGYPVLIMIWSWKLLKINTVNTVCFCCYCFMKYYEYLTRGQIRSVKHFSQYTDIVKLVHWYTFQKAFIVHHKHHKQKQHPHMKNTIFMLNV